jgi:hypothetical protein
MRMQRDDGWEAAFVSIFQQDTGKTKKWNQKGIHKELRDMQEIIAAHPFPKEDQAARRVGNLSSV